MLDVFRDAPLLTSPDGLQGGYFVAVDARKYRQVILPDAAMILF